MVVTRRRRDAAFVILREHSDKRGTFLHLLLAGCSREEIAIEMGACVETVRDHVRAILAASGAKDSRALMALALRTGTSDRVA